MFLYIIIIPFLVSIGILLIGFKKPEYIKKIALSAGSLVILGIMLMITGIGFGPISNPEGEVLIIPVKQVEIKNEITIIETEMGTIIIPSEKVKPVYSEEPFLEIQTNYYRRTDYFFESEISTWTENKYILHLPSDFLEEKIDSNINLYIDDVIWKLDVILRRGRRYSILQN